MSNEDMHIALMIR